MMREASGLPRVLVEGCCGTAEDVLAAARGGADRVELNCALSLGGLTPSLGTLRAVRERCSLPVMAMLRPRDGGFCYTEAELDAMLLDAEALLAAGADGLVFGCLCPDGTIVEERTRRLVSAAEGKETVFSRAIDVVPDWRAALDLLIRLGVTRVLTSGQRPTALEGAETIAEMIRFAGDAIEILPGSGIRPDNVRPLVEMTGCTQVHLSGSAVRRDTSCAGNPAIRFSGQLPEEGSYRGAEEAVFAAVRAALNR